MLLETGVPLTACLEALCLSEPTLIHSIHEQYLHAGARVIETNSFGANAVRLERFGLGDRVAEINRAAAALARRAVEGTNAVVAGSVGPLGISAKEARQRGIDRADCFREQITALLDAGVELLCFETFTDLDELLLAVKSTTEISSAVAVCSVVCDATAQLQCGTAFSRAVANLREVGAQIIGVNCVGGAEIIRLLEATPKGDVLAAYPSAGRPRLCSGRFVYDVTPRELAEVSRRMIGRGVRLIGGCCGTTPDHVRAVADAIRRSA